MTTGSHPARSALITAAVGLLGLAFFAAFYDAAFPTASIDLRVSRSRAQEIAQTELETRGFDVTGYKRATVFGADGLAAVFLQRTHTMEEANRLMREAFPVWHWRARWFKPLQKEEYNVFVSPSGGMVHFDQRLPEDAPGADLAQEDALVLTEEFAASKGLDLSTYEHVEAMSEKQKNRTDHRFVWERKDIAIPWRVEGNTAASEATLRLEVQVLGDHVGGYREFLKVPETFERAHSETVSQGMLLTILSFVFMVLLILASLVVLVLAVRRGEALQWKLGGILAAAVFALGVVQLLNTVPLLKDHYQTEMGYGTFWGMMLAGQVMTGLVFGAVIFLTFTTGTGLARASYPNSLTPLEGRGLGWATLRGYGLGAAFIGYVTLFYVVGRRFLDVWLPAESPYSNILATSVPTLFPLTAGLVAASWEECTFRLFAVSLLKRYARWTPVALVVPAIIWAFGHSSYPIFPVYVRGIELTIAGVIFGLFFIKFDLVTVLIAHYVINALVVSVPLLRAGELSFQISGGAVILLAAAPAVVAALVRRRE